MSDAHRDEIAKLEALYAEHPEGRIFTHLAEAYRKVGQLERARGVLEEGLDRHPGYSSAHVVLGRVLMDEGRPAEAEEEFHRVLELDSHNLVALRSLGDLARERGDDQAALDFYGRLLDVEPADGDVRELVAALGAEGEAAAGTAAAPEATPFEERAWELSESDAEQEAEGTGEADAGLAATGAGSPEEEQPDGGFSPDTGDEPFSWTSEEPEPAEAEAMASFDLGGTFEPDADDEAEPLEGFEPGTEFESPGTTPEEPAEEATWEIAGETAEEAPWETAGEGGAMEPAPDPEPWVLGGPDEAGEEALPEPAESEPAEAAKSEPASPSEAAEEAEPRTSSPGVMTETIAEVYARQGLYDRAAEVYRELVRARPLEQRLRDRLEEVERLEAESAEPAGADAATEPWSPWSQGAEASVEEAAADEGVFEGAVFKEAVVDEGVADEAASDEGDAEEVSVWTGAEWGDAGSTSPYAWDDEEGAEPDASPPIRSYVRSLLSWSPARAAGVEEPDTPERAENVIDVEAGDGVETVDEVETVAGVETAHDDVEEPAAGGETPPSGNAGNEADDDDEGLETFRAWLESLKQ